MQGLVIKVDGGLYTVESPVGVDICKARGVFRKRGIAPCTGDQVEFSDGCITEVLPRRNYLIRPPLANLDQMVFVLSVTQPAPNLLLLDRFLAVCIYKEIAPLLVFTKLDLGDAAPFAASYEQAGFPVYYVDYDRPETVQTVYELLRGKTSAFTGNSGVGKSTLLNAIDSNLQLETADISKKLGRGKHTTRVTSLYTLEHGGRVADTPGFSTFETDAYAQIAPDELAECFPEMRGHLGKCRYADCRHMREPDCAVRNAVAEGAVSQSRYESYTAMMQEILNRKMY